MLLLFAKHWLRTCYMYTCHKPNKLIVLLVEKNECIKFHGLLSNVFSVTTSKLNHSKLYEGRPYF